VYLPEGEWVDYWTKQPVASGWHTVATDNIPVYEKI
jgi:alpha-glucosidase (family GH31 glycosyl hydrolase)